ncbi:MAG: adenylate/guanylate cyclase domain-containing protein [Proteobacteria bacterium]|nr:adenylate/guanylate cyclase domain-containing protein [Pseudomonadota bacterium]
MSKRLLPRNVPLLTAAVATVLALVVLSVRGDGLFARLEGTALDARFSLRGPRAPSTDKIVIVGLDDRTRDVAPEIFQTRNGWVTLLDRLTAQNPKVIALDFFFSSPEVVLPDDVAQHVRDATAHLATAEPSEAKTALAEVGHVLEADRLLADAVARSKRVFLGAFLHVTGTRATSTGPAPVALVAAQHGDVADASGGGDLRPLTASAASYTMDSIAQGAVGAGVVNVLDDPDGVKRRMPLAVEYAGQYYMPLGLAVALAERGKSGDTRYVAGDDHLVAGGQTIALSKTASIVLDPMGRDRIPHVSAADVWNGTVPKGALDGKLVFLGYTFAAYDKVATPLDARADGVELHATLAENILSERVLVLRGGKTTMLATIALCLVVIAAQLRRIRRRAWIPPLLALAAIATYAAIAYVVFTHGTIIAIAAPCILSGLVLVAATIGGLATEGREKAQLRAVFSQYVSRAVVDRLVADPARAKLGGERKELTVLFSDIRGFSLFSEGMQPEKLATLLADYLTPMTELVLESGGTLDKYIGDAVMAIWGAPIDTTDHATRACEVALRMQEVLVQLNAEWRGQDRPEITIGIGLNTGAMAVGNMGSAARFDYTVLGDQVNLASRLEALTKEYGVAILVGEATARAAAKDFVFREIDLVRVKGRAGAAPVFELVGRDGKVATDPRFAAALAAYRARRFEDARDGFAAIPDDRAAAILAKRCEVLTRSPPPADWDGVYEQRSK